MRYKGYELYLVLQVLEMSLIRLDMMMSVLSRVQELTKP